MQTLISEYSREQVDAFWHEYWQTDWPDLGFYYRCNPDVPAWEFFATIQGYARLAQELQHYAQGLGRIMGEHDHIVPDWTLTFTTAATLFLTLVAFMVARHTSWPWPKTLLPQYQT